MMSDTIGKMHQDNRVIVAKLGEVADLLDQQGADPFRVRAYREAAAYISDLPMPLRTVFASGGSRALEALPTIGPSIATAIIEILQTGDLRLRDTLRGGLDPETLFQTVPQIGPHLAAIIHDRLDINTLEALEVAAHDGRLAELPGFGPRRVRGVQYALAELLARRKRIGAAPLSPNPPIVQTLDVDREYRQRAADGSLPMIAPQRFNPDQRAWLPILHTERGDWHFTALYSNTLQAHRLQRTKDWIVIRYEKDNEGAAQCTVVTEHRGDLAGKRVIRGHEAACADHYAKERAVSPQ